MSSRALSVVVVVVTLLLLSVPSYTFRFGGRIHGRFSRPPNERRVTVFFFFTRRDGGGGERSIYIIIIVWAGIWVFARRRLARTFGTAHTMGDRFSVPVTWWRTYITTIEVRDGWSITVVWSRGRHGCRWWGWVGGMNGDHRILQQTYIFKLYIHIYICIYCRYLYI